MFSVSSGVHFCFFLPLWYKYPDENRVLHFIAALVFSPSLAAQSTPATPQDSATFDPDGTAHITRVVPMPATISPEAQQWLASLTQNKGGQQTLAERRARTDEWRKFGSGEARKYYPANVEETTTAGVRTDIITPLAMPEAIVSRADQSARRRIQFRLGLFDRGHSDCEPGEDESCVRLLSPRAGESLSRRGGRCGRGLQGTAEDVYAASIGIFGTSAGAILTAEVAVRLKQLGLPLPAALGIFSGLGDFSRVGDSRQLFTLNGFPGEMQPIDPNHLPDDQYVGKTDRKDPVLSPLFADLHGMPPSLLVTSTRDILLSDTTTLHRALLRAGVDAHSWCSRRCRTLSGITSSCRKPKRRWN